MDHSEESTALFQALEADGELPLRLRTAPWCMPGSGEAEWKELARSIGTGGRRWSIEAIKLFVDGTVDNGTAWLYEADIHGQSTAPFWPRPEEYSAAVRYFASRGIPTATHAIGDAGVDHVLEALESLRNNVPADILHRTVHRIEHIETVPDELVARFKAQAWWPACSRPIAPTTHLPITATTGLRALARSGRTGHGAAVIFATPE